MGELTGRDLDKAVALALGYTEHVFDHAYGGEPDHIVKVSAWHLPNGDFTYQGSLPAFSSDIGAAWLVVEHMRDLWTAATSGVSGLDNDFPRPFDDTQFFERLHRHADRRWPWAFLYVTPDAICRAFLAAVNEVP